MSSIFLKKSLLLVLLILFLLGNPSSRLIANAADPIQVPSGTLSLLNRAGDEEDALVDGNLVRLKLNLSQKTAQAVDITFLIDSEQVAVCTIPKESNACTSEPLASLGWYWAADGSPHSQRILSALSSGIQLASLPIQIRPRPAVMVHGFASGWDAWTNYLGPDGYLASVGIPGYAVGDGQVEGRMNTGSLDDPAGRTNTIQQNAEIVGEYIHNVKNVTGAEMVDLIAHSMGGLISRYYIGQVMQDRDVAQLIMLGSPMAGTECANLPASLGLYLPAVLEIRPSYVESIFNQQVTSRRGLAFYALAGDPITEAFKSPCTSVPTDIAVSQSSVTAIPLNSRVMPVLHTDLNTSRTVFDEFVFPLLRKGAGGYPDQPDQAAGSVGQPLQFTRVFTGHLDPGQSQEVVIQIEDGVSVAGFSLFDTSRSLENVVHGASGKEIMLSTEANGLIVIKDPASLFYLGYGFNNPKPGQWRVTLNTTAGTPAEGADYALTAYMIGGVRLDASALPLLAQIDDAVTVNASMSLDGQPVDIQSAQARFRLPNGETLTLDLAVSAGLASLTWQPALEGLYGIDLLVTGLLPQGQVIDRTAFLSIQVQPTNPPTRTTLVILLLLVLCAILLQLGLVVLFFIRWQSRRQHSSRTH